LPGNGRLLAARARSGSRTTLAFGNPLQDYEHNLVVIIKDKTIYKNKLA